MVLFNVETDNGVWTLRRSNVACVVRIRAVSLSLLLNVLIKSLVKIVLSLTTHLASVSIQS